MNLSLKEKYKADINDYEIIRTIGRGGFGIVYLVQNKKNKKNYVAKVSIFNGSDADDYHTRIIKREISILMLIQHQTIISLRGFSLFDFNNNKNITIFMDYIEQGSLSSLLNNEQKGQCPGEYDNTKRQIILAGVARGMMILHSKNVIHRDLSSGNILIDNNFHPRITDFGLSKFFDPNNSKNQTSNDCGTAAYMAPEVILSNKFGPKADVYSFGILMFEIVTGKLAYSDFLSRKDVTTFQLKKKVTEGYRPKTEIPIKEGLNKLIQRCLSSNPNERPTFYELFQKLSLSSVEIMNQFGSNQNNFLDDILDEDDKEQYCLDGVNLDEFFDYIEDITEKDEQDKELENRLNSIEKRHNDEIKEMKKIIKDQKSQIQSLNLIVDSQAKEIELLKRRPNLGRFFYAEPSSTEPGIFFILKNMEKNRFDRFIIASSSGHDIYNLLKPDSSDSFGTSMSKSNEFIEFFLEEPVLINGIQLKSSGCNFPRSFDIKIDGTLVKSIKEATELNGKYKTMIINFNEIRGQAIRIIKTGLAWSNSPILVFKNVEVLSPDQKFSSGVFSTLIKGKDPHNCKVFISASTFDFSNFYLIDTIHKTWVKSKEQPWFQAELLRGSAIITGIRLKKKKLKCFKIIATDDASKPTDSWVTLLDVVEEINRDKKTYDVFELPHPSPLVRFVRLIMTGPDWNNFKELEFYHFEIFGYYF